MDKSRTQRAVEKRRLAYEERRDKPGAPLSRMYEEQASELLMLARPPAVGAGREVVSPQSPPTGPGCMRPRYISETLAKGATAIAEDASVMRTDLLLRPSFNAIAMGIDAAESIGAANSWEKMLAHQAAVAHEAVMKFMDAALSFEHRTAGDQVEACRCANTSARLMGAFQGAMLTLERIRNGGRQTVTVQHVNVEPGAQAVIGNVQTGGRKGRWNNGK